MSSTEAKKRIHEDDDSEKTEKKRRKTDKCPICLRTLGVAGGVDCTPCFHLFCSICLMTALEVRNWCPLCKFEIKNVDDEKTDADNNEEDSGDDEEDEEEESSNNDD